MISSSCCRSPSSNLRSPDLRDSIQLLKKSQVKKASKQIVNDPFDEESEEYVKTVKMVKPRAKTKSRDPEERPIPSPSPLKKTRTKTIVGSGLDMRTRARHAFVSLNRYVT